ncbi:MAG: hypothetical protein CMC56_03985 [Flavobacteriaceae bacterium]|nr:hypothetical protein [Flavobacteriaceae bacterium]
METGLRIIQANNNISDKNLVLSIQAGLSGLSFFVLDRFSEIIVDVIVENFSKQQTPDQLLKAVKTAFNRNDSLQQSFSKVQIIHDNEMQTLVPSALFEEAHLSDYLKYNTKIFKTDFITYDVIQNKDAMLVYIPFVNINNYIFERFGSFEYKHSATVLIDKILQLEKNNNQKKLYINIQQTHFELIAIDGNSFQLFNRFEYNTREDFIYYILFTAEQLDFNPENFKCILMGAVEDNDELFSIAYKYIRHVSLLPISNMRYNQNNSTQNFTLLNSF